ncbi:MAG: KUP/HAK/KT family potassium transporter [Opitutaceae bacterium]|jgi:KUP system potassium uptake protein|nr:KUP/HAK/KT family potassium transporter [Opitutaceae bacterium]
MDTPGRQTETAKKALKAGLCVGALGVVFGDIGTSPLYAMRMCVNAVPAGLPPEAAVMGTLSLVFWLLLLVVGLKYLLVVTRADNRGEGGIFALMALGPQPPRPKEGRVPRVALSTLLLLAGAALLYGDGVITPAVTVLSAAEGLRGFAPELPQKFIVGLACGVLAVLFWVQKKGTSAIGRVFGPAMLGWFTLIGLMGLWHIVTGPKLWGFLPKILLSINPLHAARLISQLGDWTGVSVLLGSVVLTITGAEALYADMGHFGRGAIAKAWWRGALPALLLSYFGQGALLLEKPALFAPLFASAPGSADVLPNPFFEQLPAGWPQGVLTALSVGAAVIASQAVISGAYSITRSAIQLGYFPRLKVLHTSASVAGQIYVPLINSFLAVTAIVVVLAWQSSARLASAYGVAVTGSMVVTTYAFFRAARAAWKWPWWKAAPVCGAFAALDLALFGAALHKFGDGGWLPIFIGLGMVLIMHTWKTGRNEIQMRVYGTALAEIELSTIAASKNIVRVPGSAVFMVATPRGTPLALLHHLKANKCLQKNVVLLTITTTDAPFVAPEERMTLSGLGEGVWRATGRYGYMESPDVAALCERIEAQGIPLSPLSTTFYFNREMILSGGNARMFGWQKSLYAFLSRNAHPVKDYYQILPTQIIEIGLPVQL